MSDFEFSRTIRLQNIGDGPETIEANEAERAALAKRFGIAAVKSLTAELTLLPKDGEVITSGRFVAEIVQACAVSVEDFATRISEKLDLRFVQGVAEDAAPDEEIELTESDLDVIDFDGETVDMGEAVAQSLGLAIDPFARGPNADKVREEAGIVDEDAPSGPLAEALAALKK
ncbi:DUF177 domain-containing protein [Altererythrobacter sp. ZODW24]|uniref:YceD family protein n=1 Tax=Altererythrobacter sp. ZODW24 TaxID=2185142 RepID=UPI000DF728EC|nr:DUF177 domain-containing protein [Altererythrobacter sp. ZODW24]